MFNTICAELSLGPLIAPPRQLTGGYTHRMVEVATACGHYAVKLLNPEIMQRPGVMDNFARAERLEALLEARDLPVLPARTIGGRKMQQVAGRFLYVFDYFDGHALTDEDITPLHCERMGRVLAQIHAVDRRTPAPTSPPAPIPWEALAEELHAAPDAREESALLQAALPLLRRVTAAAEDAARCLDPMETLCHLDMDAKNVLWRGGDFRIIDLECLDYGDPRQELLDLAVSWAGWPAQEARFKAFVGAYAAAGGVMPADPALVFDSRRNHIDWLAYNVRRAGFDDPEERRIGREQIRETLGKITADQQRRGRFLRWMAESCPAD